MLAVALHGVGGQRDDRDRRRRAGERADAAGGGQAVHARHLDVHDHEVEAAAADRGQRRLAVGDHLRAVAGHGEVGAR